MEKKTFRTFIVGIIVGMLSYLGIRYLSREYRDAKKELEYLDGQLDSIEAELDLAQELESSATDTIKYVREHVERERQSVESIRAELVDDESVIANCERRIADSEIVLTECRELLKEPSDF